MYTIAINSLWNLMDNHILNIDCSDCRLIPPDKHLDLHAQKRKLDALEAAVPWGPVLVLVMTYTNDKAEE